MELAAALKCIEDEKAFVRDEEGGFTFDELQDGTFSVGRCLVASIYVRNELRTAGFDAWLTCEAHPRNQLDQDEGRHHMPWQLGLGDAKGGYPRHVAVCVFDGTEAQIIDYTANQYGYDAWPKITAVREALATQPPEVGSLGEREAPTHGPSL